LDARPEAVLVASAGGAATSAGTAGVFDDGLFVPDGLLLHARRRTTPRRRARIELGV
jgi:hypothetical protein